MTEEVTEIFPAYEEFLQPARFKVAHGGRGSAKTRTFASILLNNVDYYGWRLVCFREVMKSIEDSVFQEFVDEIDRTNRHDRFVILKKSIEAKQSGGIIKFDGLLRNIQKIKGYSGFDAAWLEEAERVSRDSWKYVIPTLRKPGSEIFVSYNPDDPLSATHQMFVTKRQYPDYLHGKRYCIVKEINYTDNPRFPQELKDDMELMKANDYELYRHVYLGQPVANNDLSIIKPTWVEASIDAHLKLGITPSGGRIGGFDVADTGPDSNAFIARHGVVVDHCEEWKDIDPNSAARHVFRESLRMKVDTVHFDNIGVGAGAKGALREEVANLSIKITPIIFEGFAANAAVDRPESEYQPGKKNKDMFLNLKSQTWWLLADRFRNTYAAVNGKPYDAEKIISLSSSLPNIENLCAELSQPRREFSNGKVKVESKDAMKKRGVMSPNLADALVMAFAPECGFSIADLL